jgi:PIN domain nuclease of toxin-antitoxin system
MKLLLDTHVLIWSTAQPQKLSQKVTNLLADTNNDWVVKRKEIYVSTKTKTDYKISFQSSIPL